MIPNSVVIPTQDTGIVSPEEISLNLKVLANIDYYFYCEMVHRGYYKTAAHLEYTCKVLEKVESGEIKRLMIFMPPRHGKLLADSTDVLTTDGWKTHGELEVGDYVYDINGRPTRVLWVSEPALANYEVEFTNGEVILCHANHEWAVYSRSHAKYMTVETNWLANRTLWQGGNGQRAIYQLPPTTISRRIGFASIKVSDNPEMGKCIQVDRADGLYLVGRSMIPTHNSMSVSETFPSWFIGKNPSRRVIEVSYGDSLARKFGRLNKLKINEYGIYLFDIRVTDDNASMTNWGIDGHRGGMICAGIGGPITGEGADLLIVDDPIKNRKEADSQAYRDMVWNEWTNTLLTRLHPNGAVIIILTRWHEDDLVGRILKNPEDAEEWTIINLPALAEGDDQLGREPGQALWPEHGYDEKWAKGKKKAVGTRTWDSLYQQRPSPDGGKIFKRDWWRYYRKLPADLDEVIQSWDCAFKDLSSSNYVVGQVWGRKGANKYLMDQIRDKMDFTVTIMAIQTMSAKWPMARLKLVEDKANGPAVIATLRSKVPGLVPVQPLGSKVARAIAASPDVEAGNVYLPDPSIAPWIHDFEEEHASFPNGVYDDQVDCTSQALNRFAISERREGWKDRPDRERSDRR